MNNKDENGKTEAEFLKDYKAGDYERPSVTVDLLLFTIHKTFVDKRKLDKTSLQLGLIKRKEHPFINHWAICGGFVNIDESLDDAAKRELKEETGIKDTYMEQLYTFGTVNRDPRMRVIDVAYYSLIPESKLLKNGYKAGDDASDIAFFDISQIELSKNEYILEFKNEEKNECIRYKIGKTIELLPESTSALAFDHIEIVNQAIMRMKNKIFYTDIAFHLLEETFTIADVHNIFETILNKPLIVQNFRKRLFNMHLIEEAEGIVTGKGFRPSQLYRLKE